jgi:3'(2'), 5'-bisphosphate nucleotidase
MSGLDQKTLEKAISASIDAGKAILEVYNTEFDVELKDDLSPLTEADKASHRVIMETLNEAHLPVLSEEGREIPYEERKNWNLFWMVDPLDGTKEFIKRNGEFTVNIALMNDSAPVFGIIYVPVHSELYFGGKEYGSYKIKNIDSALDSYDAYVARSSNLPLKEDNSVYTMIGSRSHMSDETLEYFEKIKKEKGEVSVLSRGSSLKLCMVAEGEAHEYPRFAPTMEWDTAAGQAIIEGSGGELRHYKSGEIMRYNRENLVNGWFVAKRL